MSSCYIVRVDDQESEVEYEFLGALYLFTKAVADGADDVTLKWSA